MEQDTERACCRSGEFLCDLCGEVVCAAHAMISFNDGFVLCPACDNKERNRVTWQKGGTVCHSRKHK